MIQYQMPPSGKLFLSARQGRSLELSHLEVRLTSPPSSAGNTQHSKSPSNRSGRRINSLKSKLESDLSKRSFEAEARKEIFTLKIEIRHYCRQPKGRDKQKQKKTKTKRTMRHMQDVDSTEVILITPAVTSFLVIAKSEQSACD